MGGSTFIGRVVSNRMQKSVVVAVNYVVWVPKYHVYEKRMARHMAHDGKQECVVGDLVKIKACPKMSKNKHYRVADVLRRTPVFSPSAAGAPSSRPSAAAGASGADAHAGISAVDAAEQRLATAQQRLRAVRRMYQKELGTPPGVPGEDATAAGGAMTGDAAQPRTPVSA